ncbi:MAG: hypothetical protein ACE5IR_26260 [bacterium]
MFGLGLLFQEGYDSAGNPAKNLVELQERRTWASEWFRKGALAGSPKAMHFLAKTATADAGASWLEKAQAAEKQLGWEDRFTTAAGQN